MRKILDIIAAGMAIFAMYFGAGNIIFPLAMGKVALDKSPFALAGLLLTAVLLPFLGLVTMLLYQGKIRPFFGRLGKIPGFFLAIFTIALLGPLGCAPRCIALAFSTCALSFPHLSLNLFSALACLLIFFFVIHKGSLLNLIGYVLSPFKIGLLLLIVLIGFIKAPEMAILSTPDSNGALLFYGLKQGYNTMDLLGSFFFAPVLLSSIAGRYELESKRFFLKACLIGGALLSLVYVGFCYLTYLYASELATTPTDQLLAAIAFKVLGVKGGFIVMLTVSVACLTTAIALIAAFSNFIHTELFSNKVPYLVVVLFSLLLTYGLSIVGFQGIVALLMPILEYAYPVLIALTLYNFFAKYFSLRYNET